MTPPRGALPADHPDAPVKPFEVRITDSSEFHCFCLTINPASAPGQKIEVMIHARALVDLIHECSAALCEWQQESTGFLLDKLGASHLKAK